MGAGLVSRHSRHDRSLSLAGTLRVWARQLGCTVPFSYTAEKISSMLNLSDVLTYLMSWQNGQTNLRILLSTGDGRFSFDCTLLGFSDAGISLQLSGNSNSIDLNLAGYDFEFLDESAANIPREETPAHRVYVQGLRANRGPGETLFILEVAAS
jgi:hypothetical protein